MMLVYDQEAIERLWQLSGWFGPYGVADFLKKLPAFTLIKHGDGSYDAIWQDYTNGKSLQASSRTSAANALCRLAIALFEAGVLTHD